MSNVPAGQGWWLASDGKWYAPELHPDVLRYSPAPSPGWWKASNGKWYPPDTHPGYVPPVAQVAVQVAPQVAEPVAAPVQQVAPQVAEPVAAPVQQVAPQVAEPVAAPVQQVAPQFAEPPTPTWFPSVADAQVVSANPRETLEATATIALALPDQGAGYLLTGCAILIVYLALLIEVLQHNVVLGLTYVAPVVALIVLARMWQVRTKTCSAGILAKRVSRFLNAALAVRFITLGVAVGAALVNHSNGG